MVYPYGEILFSGKKRGMKYWLMLDMDFSQNYLAGWDNSVKNKYIWLHLNKILRSAI